MLVSEVELSICRKLDICSRMWLESLGFSGSWLVSSAVMIRTNDSLESSANLLVPVALAPILWAVLNAVKSVSNIPGGALSDRVGRRPTLVAGWAVYALVYFLFARATHAWHAWALFAGYGIFFGLTEGAELAMVADVVPRDRRGAAYGWYYLAIGIGALPASLLFGVLWDRLGSAFAFSSGAALALVASIGLLVLPKQPH